MTNEVKTICEKCHTATDKLYNKMLLCDSCKQKVKDYVSKRKAQSA